MKLFSHIVQKNGKKDWKANYYAGWQIRTAAAAMAQALNLLGLPLP